VHRIPRALERLTNAIGFKSADAQQCVATIGRLPWQREPLPGPAAPLLQGRPSEAQATGYTSYIPSHRLQAAGVREVLKEPRSSALISFCLARHLSGSAQVSGEVVP
jgi:hypothetical protein